ncbi:MAG: hypothetical protein U5K74_11570 [Gemmatimonadaceae bacterium]|nr:hypothetical protein [Gemmatimonadaceae bacterium]
MLALVALSLVAQRTANATSDTALERTTRLIGVLLQEREAGLARAVQVFAQNPNFRSLLLGGRTQDVLDQAIEAAQRTGAHVGPGHQLSVGTRLAKSDEPAAAAGQRSPAPPSSPAPSRGSPRGVSGRRATRRSSRRSLSRSSARRRSQGP